VEVACFPITDVVRLLLGTLPTLKSSWEAEARKHRENYYVRHAAFHLIVCRSNMIVLRIGSCARLA
jgi:hypothetical protein